MGFAICLELADRGRVVLRGKCGKLQFVAAFRLEPFPRRRAGPAQQLERTIRPAAADEGCGKIEPGQGLIQGHAFSSCGGVYALDMQKDGNLVLYHGAGHAIWATATDGCDGYKAVMQGDGNFVLYDTRGHALWASGTSGHPGAYLSVQEDGNLVVYAAGGTPALWASGTNGD